MKENIIVGVDFCHYIFEQDVVNGDFTFSISRFVADIIDGLESDDCDKNIVIFSHGWSREFLKKRFPKAEVVSIDNKLIELLRKITRRSLYRIFDTNKMLCKRVNNSNIDIYWDPYVRMWKGEIRKKRVVTIHDLIDYKKNDQDDNEGLEKALLSADHIVAISEYVKKDCINTFPINSDKMSVIPNAIYINSENGIEESLDIKSDYILDINAFRRHKNTIALIRAYALIADKIPNDLVLCGGGKQEDYFSEICSEIERLNLQNRVTILYQISDANLKWLYNHAVLFVNPSLEEGFGRTPVEAIMHGVPVLTTKETSLYEVTLGLLDYIDDPDDPQEISNKIMNILESGVEYNVNSIKERYIEEYKPKRIAQKYWDLFLKTDDESAISQ